MVNLDLMEREEPPDFQGNRGHQVQQDSQVPLGNREPMGSQGQLDWLGSQDPEVSSFIFIIYHCFRVFIIYSSRGLCSNPIKCGLS